MKNQSILSTIDWSIILIYFILVILGWMNIYSSSLPLVETSLLDMNEVYGKQLVFIILSVPVIIITLNLNAKIFERFSFVFYGIGVFLLLGLFVFGSTIKGQTNWYKIGGFTFQPSEVVKISCSLLLAKFISIANINLSKQRHQIVALAIIGIPVFLILMQPDAGSAMIFWHLFLF